MALNTPPIPKPEASVCNRNVSSLQHIVRAAVSQTASFQSTKILFISFVQTTLFGAFELVDGVNLTE